MAHVCTVCHPDGLLTGSPKEHNHRPAKGEALDGSCCVGCACGWWREDESIDSATRAKAEKLAVAHDHRRRMRP